MTDTAQRRQAIISMRSACLLAILTIHASINVNANMHGVTNMQTSSVKAFMRRSGRSRRGNYYNLSSPSLASRGFSVSGGASAEGDVDVDADADANDEIETTSAQNEMTTVAPENTSNSVDEDEMMRSSSTEILSPTEDSEVKVEGEVEAVPVPDVDDVEPAAISTAPVRISTNESGAVVVAEDKNLEAKLTRKEKRMERKKKRGEEKSHQKYAKKLKVSRLI